MLVDLTGQRFGKLVVIEKNGTANGGDPIWKCKCDCGNEIDVRASRLKRGEKQDCGCVHEEKVKEKLLKMVGMRFGKLTVIAPAERAANGDLRLLCKCDCGNEKIISKSSLLYGNTKSCGCARSVSRIEDITGERFNKLTVIKRVDNKVISSGRQLAQWLCKCDCGNELIVSGAQLRSGNVKNCGCINSNPSYVDLTGKTFGEWTVLKRSDVRKKNITLWTCKCSCGTVRDVEATRLKTGKSKSCGHLHLTKGNLSKERIYGVWRNMMARCYKPTAAKSDTYGGRGISVCDEWHDYLIFRDWAYKNGYDKDAPVKACTIDRIDSNGNYCPENCRWTDWNTQVNNRRACKYITIDGVTHDMSEWGRIMGIAKSTIRSRLATGWSEYDAIMTPVKHKRKDV